MGTPEQIASYYVAGHTLQETGDHFGYSREWVRLVLVELGITYRHDYRKPKPPPLTPEEKWQRKVDKRIWARIDKRGPDECWDWKGKCNSVSQYPRIGALKGAPWPNGSAQRVQVAIWWLTHGPPTGWIVNTCRNVKCCNERHLADLSPTEAIRKYRRTARGRRNAPSKFAPYAPAIQVLMAKGWSVMAIHRWLSDHGVHVAEVTAYKLSKLEDDGKDT